MSIILHRKFVCADAENNNNKFWEVILDDANQATIKFGRVGATASIKTKIMTLAQVEKEIKEKTKPGRKNGSYTEIEIVAESISKPSSTNVINTAVRDIAGQNNILIDLVSLLAEANRHELNIAVHFRLFESVIISLREKTVQVFGNVGKHQAACANTKILVDGRFN